MIQYLSKELQVKKLTYISYLLHKKNNLLDSYAIGIIGSLNRARQISWIKKCSSMSYAH